MDANNIGRQVAALRKERGLTQDRLAEMLDISPQAVSKWENGHALPETAVLPGLARALDCGIDTLFGLNALVVLDARYGDGLEQVDITKRINRLVDNETLYIPPGSGLLPVLETGRVCYLTVKYQSAAGVFFACFREDEPVSITADSRGYTSRDLPCGNAEDNTAALRVVAGSYGNAKAYYDAMQKITHYGVFNWDGYRADHECFPSHPGNDEKEYLTLVYINADGIRIATCEEGEKLSYNNNKTELFRQAGVSAANTYAIPGVECLPPFGSGMECSWAAALTAALTAMGVRTDYAEVMGVSGACYRLAFCSPGWDYSAVDGLVAYDYATPGYQAFGYTAVCSAHIEKKQRAAERAKIIAQLQHNMPVLAINLRVAPEWGVITGYFNGGEALPTQEGVTTLLCRTKYDKAEGCEQQEAYAPDGYAPADNWPFLIMYFEGKTATPNAQSNYFNSLRIFTDCAALTHNRGYAMGFAAYEAWINDLTDEPWYTANDDAHFERRLSVNQFCVLSLYDAREAAHTYLSRGAALFTDDLHSLAEKIALLFGEITERAGRIHRLMDTGGVLTGENARRFWDTGKRREQAALLSDMLALEQEACRTACEMLTLA